MDSRLPHPPSPARRQGLALGGILGRTLVHFWPDYKSWLGKVTDTRVQELCIYDRKFLLIQGLMLFLLKLGSRRQVRFEMDSPEALENLNRLSGCSQETLAHGDTLDHFLGHVPPRALDRLRRSMVHRLIRMKALDDGRLFGYFLIVLDGTGQFYFHRRHCEHCLTKTVNGKTQYYHHVLEAKLVTPDGLALSIGSEFIENSDPNATKQDCEIKAFLRLTRRLKKDFPQLRMCLCLDGLYANGTVLSICRENHWKYFITFKEGSMPAVWKEYQTLRELSPQNRKSHTTDAGVPQSFAWVEDLQYVDDQNRRQQFHAMQCREQNGRDTKFFAWLTNFTIRPENVVALGNRGGRCRWKIENEGFNIQKNGGFNLEHAYGMGERQIKNYYVLLQIAHMILQLIECGNLLTADARRLFGSLRNLARRLAESLRNRLIPPEAIDPAAAQGIQIRLDSS
jgi:hypothetical protein